MLTPLSWLKEYVALDLPLDTLTDRLTLGGLEVESVEQIGSKWDRDKIVVAQVVGVRPHPDADRLVLVTVDCGRGSPIEVVTGAPNLHVGDAGQKVAFAMVGATLIEPYAETLAYKTLKPSKIRGVMSTGMVCSEKELGLSDEHTGIIILPDDAPVGAPLADYWGDTVLDIKLTPNLARCLSMVGVAREAGALTGSRFDLPAPQVLAQGAAIAGQIEIAIDAPDLCSRYSAALIKDVRIGPSPIWMQRRLRMAGMRPINNIVDITNYVMLEWGQPLHAFDYRKLAPHNPGSAPAIVVRRAAEGEVMTTLDGVKRTLTHDTLLITDGRGPVGIAGIMGGLASEVTAETTDILLEAANFHYLNIRHSTEALKLPSEAALRFGRGVDPELTLVALRRATELMRALAGGTVAGSFADAYPVVPAVRVIDLKVSEVKRVIGIDLTAQAVSEMLTALGFGCEVVPVGAGESALVRTTVPSARLDVSIPADLLEEVARMYGYDRLPTTLLASELPAQIPDPIQALEERVRDILVGCGLTETIAYSTTSLESVARLTPDRVRPEASGYLQLANPLSREHEFMRQTLMNTALETVASNLRFVERVAIYEVARVYLPAPDERLPRQPRRLMLALCGPREERSWLRPECGAQSGGALGFYDLKGVIEQLCASLGVDGTSYRPLQHATFGSGRGAGLFLAEQQIGVLGEVHPTVRANFDLPEQTVCLAEIDLDALLAAADGLAKFKAVSRMPALKEDLALVVDEAVPADALQAAIHKAGGALLVDVLLFDVYRGQQIG
ncbi:MAG: phenylalanine--tRNA ligase subunit beta, partial [Chloroflexi bacterium]|nr:phenylalanine--tRNA ligase subunit beta [Chloroflexota bacterium]